MEIKEELEKLNVDLKTYFDKAAEEKKLFGETLDATKAAIEAVKKQMDDLQKQTDAIDLKLNTERFGNGLPDMKSVGHAVTESDEFKAAKAADWVTFRQRDGRLRIPVPDLFSGRKAITTIGLGTGTSGVQMPLRLPGITDLPRQELRVRDLMTVRQMTTGNSFDYVRQLARTNAASPVHEGTRKPESTYTWESRSGTIKTIAHFTKASRQAVDDVPWLRNAIDTELLFGLAIKEEAEILSGDGTGQHLDGLIHQATAYDTGLNVAGDTPLDKLRHAKLQARLIGLGTFAPDGIVISPTDMHNIELLKTEEGGANKGMYIVGDPRGGARIPLLWGLPAVESDAITTGNFLVGAFGTGAELIDRMQAMVAIAYENEADFVENLVTILAEERLGLAVRRPDAFIYGAF